MSIRTLLISLVFCLCAGSVCADINVDYVSFVWEAAAQSASLFGGGATKAAWDAGSPSDFFDTTTGNAIVNDSGVTVTDSGGLIHLAKNNAFTDAVSKTISNIDFAHGDYDGLDGYWVITKINNSEVTLDGSTYPGIDTTCSVIVGGAINGLASLIASAADLADASSVNCDVLIRGNETLSAGLTVIAGGGTTTTLLRFLGVDASWDRIVPTRTTASGGSKANYLLDTSAMPTITLGANYLLFDVDYVQVDGLYFTGTRTFAMVGSTSGDQQIYSNCVIDNASTAGSAIALLSDNNTTIFNCDVIASGASGTTIVISIDNTAHIYNCRIVNNSNNAASIGIEIQGGEIIGCVFYKIDGIGIQYTTLSTQWVVGHCTFYDVIKPITTGNVAATVYTQLFNNVAEAIGGTETFIDNLYSGTRKVQLFAQYNQLFNFGTDYNNYVGEQGFQDLASDPLFINEANDNYNLQSGSPAKNSSPFLINRGAMSDIEADGGGRTPGIGKGIGG